jgi:AAA ATPase domain/Double zinc ribbon
MRCPSCQVDNPPENWFCEQRGAPLAARCTQCGAPVGLGVRFCGACGHRLMRPGAGAPAHASQLGVVAALLTADTLRLVEGYLEVKSLGPVPVKGVKAPMEIYELLRAGPVRSRQQAGAARGLTRFVGRDAELNQLRQALERAGAGHGQVVALVGEPGVGKSRLVYEFTRSHRTLRWLLLESSSVSYGKATPYLPVIDLLKEYFGIEDRDDARRTHEKVIGKLLILDEAMGPGAPAFLALLDVVVEDAQWQALDPPQRRQRTLDAIKRLMLRESQVQSLLLVFEDLHWIDVETQAFLNSLIESLPTARLLLLVDYRPEYQHGWGRKTYYTQLRLDPLPSMSAHELLQALLGTEPSLTSLACARSRHTVTSASAPCMPRWVDRSKLAPNWPLPSSCTGRWR